MSIDYSPNRIRLLRQLQLRHAPLFVNSAAALAAGFRAGTVYRTASGGLFRVIGSGGGGDPGSPDYSYIDNYINEADTVFVVSMTATTPGTGGSELSPFTVAQMWELNPSGDGIYFDVIPGNHDFTGVNPDSKMPFHQPLFPGTEARPVVVNCRFQASRASTTSEQMSSFRRVGGAGSIIGTEGAGDHWKISGFNLPTAHGGNGDENAHVAVRGATGFEWVRSRINGQSAGIGSGSTNGGGIFMQGVNNCRFSDIIIENIGNPAGTEIWSAVEMYDTQDTIIEYITATDIWGFGAFMKGAPDQQFLRNRIRHIKAVRCKDTGFFAYDVEAGSLLANANLWYNLLADECGHGIQLNVIGGPHRGTHFQNATCARSVNSSIMFRPVGYSEDISVRNCVFYDAPKHIEFLDAFYPSSGGDPEVQGYGNELIEFDYNRYNDHSNVMESATGSDATLANWVSRSSHDVNSDDAVPVFVNAGTGDFRTPEGATADAPDNLNVMGASMVPRGCFGTVGCRTDV